MRTGNAVIRGPANGVTVDGMVEGQMPRPDRARRPVEIATGLACRRLTVSGAPDPGSPDDALLWKHSPQIVILPEADPMSPPPYPAGARDYQPHPVDLYLADIRTVRQVPRGALGWLNVLYTGFSYGLVIATILAALEGVPRTTFLILLGATLLNLAVANVLIVPIFRAVGTPADETELRGRVAKDGAKDFATTIFGWLHGPAAIVAWDRYRQAIGADPPEPAVYGRVVLVDGRKVLQYWFFYYYNDWWNQHEADWEVVMVHLDAADQPVGVVCSSHLAGTWRSWRATEPIGKHKEQPTVYVARGSHAMYFNAADGMHYAVLHHPWSVLDLSGQFIVRGQRDAVGSPVEPPGTYRLIVIPPGADAIRSCDPGWADWWWLRFQGRFGATDGILSPPFQEAGLRWSRPIEWARDYCEPDSESWDDLFDPARQARRSSAAPS